MNILRSNRRKFHWDNKEISNTSHHIWQEVLTGSAQLHIPKTTSTTKPIAIIKFQNNTIALTLEEKERICIEKFYSCREAYKTASKEIYLILTNSSNRNFIKPSNFFTFQFLQLRISSPSNFFNFPSTLGRKKTRRWHIQPYPRQCKGNSFSQTDDGQPEQQSRRYRGQIEADWGSDQAY